MCLQEVLFGGIAKNFLNTGTCHNRNKGNSGRQRTARSAENIEAVRTLLLENPGNVSARHQHFEISPASFNRITVWVGLFGNAQIVGPYFFGRNVNGLDYLRLLNEYVFLQLALHFQEQYVDGLFRNLWWAQDGAPAHRLVQVRDRLSEVF